MNPFLRISNEIWMLILSSDLERDDLYSASLACRHFRDVTQPLLFVDVSLKIGGVLVNTTQRKSTWYPLSSKSESDTRERLRFITSVQIAPFVETLRIGYKWVATEKDDSICPEQGTGLLDEAISYLPQLTSLKRLIISWSPVTPSFVQGLHHPALSQAHISFYECVPMEEIDEPIVGTHKGEVTIIGSQNLDVNLAPLFRAFWAQSLTQLDVRKIPTSAIYEEALKSWGQLEALHTLTVDDGSLEAILRYSELFPNVNTIRIREDINSSNISIDIPSISFPKLEVLECSLRHLSHFMGRPIRKLDLLAERFWLEEDNSAGVGAEIERNRRLLSQLSELNVRNLTSEGDILEEMISSCPGLVSLRIDTYQPAGQSDKRPSEIKLKEFLDRLHRINWPLKLKTLRIEPSNSWEGIPEDRHTHQQLILETLNSLNMSDFPTRLREITFVTALRGFYYECQSFAFVAHEGGIGKWRLYETYKEGGHEYF